MSMKKKILTAMASVLILTAIPSVTSFAGQWKQNDIGYWYENDQGSYVKNSWLSDDGKWYHFDNNGYMQKNEWIMDSGKWYYLDAEGICLMNTTTPDNYTVGPDGARIFQMPATGLPDLKSMILTSEEEKYNFILELETSPDSLWEIITYEQLIPDDMNEIVTDVDYYGALCKHILKKYKNASLAQPMSSNNPAIRVYGYFVEEYRQLYIKYLSSMSKNLTNRQYAAYVENMNKLDKETTQLIERYEPYLDEISNWYSFLYYDYDYGYDYDYSNDYDYSY